MSAPGSGLAGRGALDGGGLSTTTRGLLFDVVVLGSPTGQGAVFSPDAALAFDAAEFDADLTLTNADLTIETGLLTAIVLSLFSDARARPDDPLPVPGEPPRGWWGDLLAEVANDRFGSRLWLLSREKVQPSTLARAIEYAREAVQWILDDQIAQQVEVTGEWQQIRGEAVPTVLALQVSVWKPDLAKVAYQFRYLWGG